MPAPKIPRKPIPKFTKAELNRANLWAAAGSVDTDLS